MEPAIIRKLGKFSRLSLADKAELTRASPQHLRHRLAREDIIQEGDNPDVINVIQEGWACRYKQLEDGRRQIVGFFLPGDVCDLHVFILRQMDHSIGAITPVTFGEINRREFEHLTLNRPRIMQGLWWDSLVATAVQREWTVNVGQRSAAERMAHLLCELFLRLDVVGMVNGDTCEFPLTQNDLGEALGLSTVHINRTLQELRNLELIILKDRSLTMLDLARLKTLALFNADYLHLDKEGRHLDANDG